MALCQSLTLIWIQRQKKMDSCGDSSEEDSTLDKANIIVRTLDPDTSDIDLSR